MTEALGTLFVVIAILGFGFAVTGAIWLLSGLDDGGEVETRRRDRW